MQLIAVDTNILLHQAKGIETVIDALQLLRKRISHLKILALPTVLAELEFMCEEAHPLHDLAVKAMGQLQEWDIQPVHFIPADDNLIEANALKIRQLAFLPKEEISDSMIVIEAAYLNCSILLSSDRHLLGIPYEPYKLVMEAMDLPAPLLQSPAGILRKFSR